MMWSSNEGVNYSEKNSLENIEIPFAERLFAGLRKNVKVIVIWGWRA